MQLNCGAKAKYCLSDSRLSVGRDSKEGEIILNVRLLIKLKFSVHNVIL